MKEYLPISTHSHRFEHVCEQGNICQLKPNILHGHYVSRVRQHNIPPMRCSGGAGGRKGRPSRGPIFFVFMQFSRKTGQNIRHVVPSGGVSANLLVKIVDSPPRWSTTIVLKRWDSSVTLDRPSVASPFLCGQIEFRRTRPVWLVEILAVLWWLLLMKFSRRSRCNIWKNC